jgi:hypothetical protein
MSFAPAHDAQHSLAYVQPPEAQHAVNGAAGTGTHTVSNKLSGVCLE